LTFGRPSADKARQARVAKAEAAALPARRNSGAAKGATAEKGARPTRGAAPAKPRAPRKGPDHKG
ncbi:hypothetical protein ACNJUT_22055, partial [Mycobacterium tuberculosis]